MEYNLDDIEIVWEKSNDTLDDSPPLYIEREREETDFIRERALHEASHLVFCRLINRLDLGFPSTSKIDIRIIDNGGGNHCGCGIKIHGYTDKKAYIDNTERIFPKLLMVIAGYTSFYHYNSKIEDREYFIGTIKGSFYALKTATQYTASDIGYTLSWIHTFIQESDLWDSVLNDLFNTALTIMSDENVEAAINIVSDQLIENPQKVPDGEELDLLLNEVDDKLGDYSIDNYCNDLYVKYEPRYIEPK